MADSEAPASKPVAKPAGGGLREKIKNSSKEELEVLANKLVDSLRVAKDQASKLQVEKTGFEKQLAEKDADIEALKKRESDLLLAASTSFSADGHETTVASSSENEQERVEELERLREKAEKERKRREEDLEAARELNQELRSQLEDARAEVTTLKETKASVDVASLELADYAKKVSQLSKELKEVKETLVQAERAKGELAGELSTLREEQGKTAADSERAKSSADEMRKRAEEESTRLAELQLRVDEERRKGERLQEELTRERVALGRQLTGCQERTAKLEEIVEVLREENGRLRKERETVDARIEEVQKEYEGFKNRARYVLEQRTRETEGEEERERERKGEEERREKEREEMRAEMERLREQLHRSESDSLRWREQLEREKEERGRVKREREEGEERVAKALDEIRSLRLHGERLEEEKEEMRREREESERKREEGEKRMRGMRKEMEELQEKSDESIHRLEASLDEERKKREEMGRAMEEKRERSGKVAPVAAVYPHFNESFHSDRSHSPMGEHLPGGGLHGGPKSVMSYAAGAHNYSFDETQRSEMSPERLESVLFGEEACDEGRPIDEIVPLEDPVEECARLRVQLKWMQEMHTEAETAAENMGEQMRVLKEEIRRLQRNSERISHVEGNTEYLKNVIVKFIQPEKVAGERRALIPILNTMLRLSEEERTVLQTVADTAPPDAAAAAEAGGGWGGMLTKWTGLS